MREPAFWWRKPGLAAGLLAPAGACYGAIAARRMAQAGARAGVPVICVGNFTLGGAGKTPTAIMLAKMLQEAGERVFCLSRGYGGSVAGPKRVDAQPTRAAQVGDEALLLARVAPTIVARDRVAGAQARAAAGASVIVMDDGLQNPSLAKDFTIAVVDGRRGIGNGACFRPGRCARRSRRSSRAPTRCWWSATARPRALSSPPRRGLPVFHGRFVPDAAAVAALQGAQGAGLCRHRRSGEILRDRRRGRHRRSPQRRAFPDHHRFTAEEAAELVMQAEHDGLALLTTEKDRARMAGEPRWRRSPTSARAAGDAGGGGGGRVADAGAGEAAALATCAAAAAPLQHRLRRGIGLLQVDAPVFELLERDRHAGDRAAHEGAGPHDAEIAVEIFDLGLAVHRRGAIVAIEQGWPPWTSGAG